MDNQEQYLSEKSLAKKWSISHKTLQRWRWLKMGPGYIKIGGRIRYPQNLIEEFESRNSYLTPTPPASPMLNPIAEVQYE